MTALAAARKTEQWGAGHALSVIRDFPLAANAIVYNGGLGCFDLASGFGVAGSTKLGLVAAGRIQVLANGGKADNTGGSNGDIHVDVTPGVFRWANSTSGDAITTAHRCRLCYIVDDQTVALTNGSGTRSVAGIIVDVDTSGVFVMSSPEIGFNLIASAAGAVSTPTTVSAAGALPLGVTDVFLSVTGTTAYTLADGLFAGQAITFTVVAGASTPAGTITPAHPRTGDGVASALGAVGDFVRYVWDGTQWTITANGGITIS
jgi:hypothetical protein